MKVKLAKALKEKNRLVGEINRLKNLFSRENSRNVKSTSKVDCGTVWTDLEAATEKLIKVKTEIFKANAGIYDKIVRMGEIKDRIRWVEAVETKDGTEERPYSNVTLVTETVAWMKQEDQDKTILDFQNEVAKLQDEIDEYNATVSVEI